MSVSRLTRTATIARTAAWTSLLLAAVACTPTAPSSDGTHETSSAMAIDPTAGSDATTHAISSARVPESEPPPESMSCGQCTAWYEPGAVLAGPEDVASCALSPSCPSSHVYQDMSFSPYLPS